MPVCSVSWRMRARSGSGGAAGRALHSGRCAGRRAGCGRPGQVGERVAGAEHRRTNLGALQRQAFEQRLGERHDAMLARTLYGPVALHQPGGGRGVDDVPLLAVGQHQRHERVDAVDHAPQVHARASIASPSASRPRCGPRASRRCRRCCRGCCTLPKRSILSRARFSTDAAVGDVRDDAVHLELLLAQPGHRRLERGASMSAMTIFMPSWANRVAMRKADAAGAARNDGDLAFELVHLSLPAPGSRRSRRGSSGARASTSAFWLPARAHLAAGRP